MRESSVGAAVEGSMADRLGSAKRRVRAAFDTMAEATTTVPRMHAEVARRLRAPLGRLVAAGQGRDAFDQRIAHLEAAIEGAQGCQETVRMAVRHLCAMHLVEIASELEKTAETAGGAYRAILDLAQRATSPEADFDLPREIASTLAVLGRQGLSAAADLTAAAEIMGAEADGQRQSAGRERIEGLGADALDWVSALYTMDDERRTHRMALAQAGLV